VRERGACEIIFIILEKDTGEKGGKATTHSHSTDFFHSRTVLYTITITTQVQSISIIVLETSLIRYHVHTWSWTSQMRSALHISHDQVHAPAGSRATASCGRETTHVGGRLETRLRPFVMSVARAEQREVPLAREQAAKGSPRLQKAPRPRSPKGRTRCKARWHTL
jgi:hypothetical protein